MIICPLTNDECEKKIRPKIKNVFIMSRSKKSLSPKEADLAKAINKVCKKLELYNYKYTFGAELFGVGDYFCSICNDILGSPFGIAFFNINTPVSSLCNIFTEKGLMNGFGKPVILFIDNYKNLPSDFSREYVIEYKGKDYLKKFDNLIKKINNFPEYYIKLGEIAIEANDYEKATRYFKEAVLIGGESNIICIKKLVKILKQNNLKTEGMRNRVSNDINSFLKLV